MKTIAYAILFGIFGCAAVTPPPPSHYEASEESEPRRRECGEARRITAPVRQCARPNCCGDCDKEDLCCCWHGEHKCTCPKPKDPSRGGR